MLIDQIIEYKLKRPAPPWPYMYSYEWLISWQNKNLQGISSSGLLFTAIILHEAMHLYFPYLGQITYKIYHQNARF